MMKKHHSTKPRSFKQLFDEAAKGPIYHIEGVRLSVDAATFVLNDVLEYLCMTNRTRIVEPALKELVQDLKKTLEKLDVLEKIVLKEKRYAKKK